MKKVLVMMLTLMFVLSCILLVACNAKVTDLKIENAPTQVTRGETIDYSKINVVATYDDGATKTLALTDKGVSYKAVDTSTTGAKTLEASFGGKSAQATITVVGGDVEIDDVTVTEFNNTDGYNEYLDAKKAQSNKEVEFYNREEYYKVGTANGYRFLPVVTAIDENDEEIILENVNTTFKLFRKDGANYVEITGDGLNTYLSKVENNVYYFTEAAEHEVFKLEVTLGEGYNLLVEAMNKTETQEFEVVSGYNAYDALGMSVLDNRNNKAWASIKEHKFAWDNGKKLSDFTDVEQVILHNNITVKASDLPASYFWKVNDPATREGSVSYADALKRAPEDLRPYLAGSLKEVYLGESWEDSDIHQRGLFVSDGIGLSGNYLKIDYVANVNKNAQNGIYVVYDFNQSEGKTTAYPESHFSLICYRHEGIDESKVKGNRTVENVYFVGQTSKTENTTTPAGIMMISSNINSLTVKNTIGTKWFSNFTLDGVDNGTISIESCKLYDSFSQMVFSYRSKAITISNCEMKRAGGPIMIINTRTGGGDNNVTDTVVNIDSTANLESLLTGAEMWFTINNLPETDIQKLLDVATISDNVVGTHYKANNKVNLIAVVIPSPGDVFTNQHAIKGAMNIGETSYDMQNSVFSTLANLSNIAKTGEALAQSTVEAMQALGQPTSDLEAIRDGFGGMKTSAASLQVAPIYQCGGVYGMFNGQKFESLSEEVKTAQFDALYGGVNAVISQLESFAGMLEGDQQATAQALLAQWKALELSLNPLGTLEIGSDWSSSWTAGHLAAWISAGGLDAGNINLNIKHFMVLLGEGTVA